MGGVNVPGLLGYVPSGNLACAWTQMLEPDFTSTQPTVDTVAVVAAGMRTIIGARLLLNTNQYTRQSLLSRLCLVVRPAFC